MAYTPLPRGERIRETQALIEAQIQLKKYYASFYTPEVRDRQLAEAQRLRDNAAKIIAQAERIEGACRDWRAGYDAADARMIELRRQLKMIENEDKLERLQNIAQQIEELSA